MLHGLPHAVAMLSKNESQSMPHHVDVNAGNAKGIPMDLTDRPYPMCGQECPDCMYGELPRKCFLQRDHRESHWCDSCGYSKGSPGERLSQEVNAMKVNAKFFSTVSESLKSFDVGNDSCAPVTSLRRATMISMGKSTMSFTVFLYSLWKGPR